MRARSEMVVAETRLGEGNAVEEITGSAKSGAFDLIVVGARGLGTIRKILIGSVSEGVRKKCSLPRVDS